jgi:hypothetical protein
VLRVNRSAVARPAIPAPMTSAVAMASPFPLGLRLANVQKFLKTG